MLWPWGNDGWVASLTPRGIPQPDLASTHRETNCPISTPASEAFVAPGGEEPEVKRPPSGWNWQWLVFRDAPFWLALRGTPKEKPTPCLGCPQKKTHPYDVTLGTKCTMEMVSGGPKCMWSASPLRVRPEELGKNRRDGIRRRASIHETTGQISIDQIDIELE